MASGNMIPSNGTNLIQTSQGFPCVAVQVSGAIPNHQYGAQQLGTSINAQQVPPNRLERFFNAEIKVLGFISSGSLCISAAKNQNRSLVKCCVGMNITSAIIALFGILLYILELTMGDSFSLNFNSEDWIKKVGICLSSVLFLFRLLEFSIAVSLAHFGCQATCCADDQAAMGYQVISGYAPVSTETNSSFPPAYDQPE
uniref:Membrane spanning 4-domains A8 n=1 Tax=Pseudonaja textilis TaxID=8673 RepID=A0A670ZHL0_PSETE